jgi:hypothetical protein
MGRIITETEPELVGTQYHYDEMEDKLTVRRVQDVEPIVERNKALANDAPTTWQRDMHHVASIPLVIIEKVKNEQGIDLLKDAVAMKRFLNDPDNAFLRTKRGRV